MRLTFLSYSSRSGSTFLAKRIAETGNILVVPEMQCPYLLLTRDPGSSVMPDELARLVANDPQISWPVARPDKPLTVAEAVRHLVGSYARSVGYVGTDALVKLGGLPLIDQRARRHLPDLRYINVLRDGRAVVNSLLSTKSPYLGGGMSMGYGDPVWAARRWRDDVAAEMNLAMAYPAHVICVRYEELVSETEATIKSIFAQSGWQPGESAGFQVHSEERAIHPNIDQPALDVRVGAWRGEMNRKDRIVVEAIAGPWLDRLGYEEHLEISGLERRRVMARATVRHFALQLRAVALRLRRIGGWAQLVDKLRYLRARGGRAL